MNLNSQAKEVHIRMRVSMSEFPLQDCRNAVPSFRHRFAAWSSSPLRLDRFQSLTQGVVSVLTSLPGEIPTSIY